MGCGTSVPGRHLPAPRVASGCLLRASTPGKSWFTGRPLTHRRTNPVQAHSLRHAFLHACPHPPSTLSPSIPLPLPPLLWGAESLFSRPASSPVSRRMSVPTRQRAGKACPHAALPPEVSALHAGSWYQVRPARGLKAQARISQSCLLLPGAPGLKSRQRPSQSPLSKVLDLPRAFSSIGFSSEPQRLRAWKRPLKKGFSVTMVKPEVTGGGGFFLPACERVRMTQKWILAGLLALEHNTQFMFIDHSQCVQLCRKHTSHKASHLILTAPYEVTSIITLTL